MCLCGYPLDFIIGFHRHLGFVSNPFKCNIFFDVSNGFGKQGGAEPGSSCIGEALLRSDKPVNKLSRIIPRQKIPLESCLSSLKVCLGCQGEVNTAFKSILLGSSK